MLGKPPGMFRGNSEPQMHTTKMTHEKQSAQLLLSQDTHSLEDAAPGPWGQAAQAWCSVLPCTAVSHPGARVAASHV